MSIMISVPELRTRATNLRGQLDALARPGTP